MRQSQPWGAITALANGSLFLTEGPTTENARVFRVEVRANGTKSTPRSIIRYLYGCC